MASNYPDDEGRDYVKELSRDELQAERIWVTQDRRFLLIITIPYNHLKNIEGFVNNKLIEAEQEVSHIHALEDYKEDPWMLVDACKEEKYWSDWLKIIRQELKRRE